MESRNSTWFEVKVKIDRVQDNGQNKSLTELYVSEALTCGEAETRITEEVAPEANGNFSIEQISIAKYRDVIADDGNSEKWFKVKVAFITLDEVSAKEKRTSVLHLVQGSSLESAVDNVTQFYESSFTDYEITNVTETKVIDVYHG